MRAREGQWPAGFADDLHRPFVEGTDCIRASSFWSGSSTFHNEPKTSGLINSITLPGNENRPNAPPRLRGDSLPPSMETA